MKPPEPTEIDSVESIREAMIERRNKALIETNFNDAVLFTHCIGWLSFLQTWKDNP